MTNFRPYLAGPIMGCTDSEANDWRGDLTRVWPCAINPMVRDYRGVEAKSVNEIVDLDKRDIRRCDAVIANCSQPSVGTSMEIFYAHSLGIPVIVWIPADVAISPWLAYHATTIIHSPACLVRAMARFEL